MNTKTEQQIAAIKSQTIGVEIEMNNITRSDAARIAAEYFGTHRPRHLNPQLKRRCILQIRPRSLTTTKPATATGIT